jgi:hypothetical protein
MLRMVAPIASEMAVASWISKLRVDDMIRLCQRVLNVHQVWVYQVYHQKHRCTANSDDPRQGCRTTFASPWQNGTAVALWQRSFNKTGIPGSSQNNIGCWPLFERCQCQGYDGSFVAGMPTNEAGSNSKGPGGLRAKPWRKLCLPCFFLPSLCIFSTSSGVPSNHTAQPSPAFAPPNCRRRYGMDTLRLRRTPLAAVPSTSTKRP